MIIDIRSWIIQFLTERALDPFPFFVNRKTTRKKDVPDDLYILLPHLMPSQPLKYLRFTILHHLEIKSAIKTIVLLCSDKH